METSRRDMMGFKENGHFDRNEFTESEVSHECSKTQTKLGDMGLDVNLVVEGR